ncbi:uncharacterized protein VTP21DRAFT_2386 [Calcarisporiella thermophila]|uniref:uncharacterized protein n=1 Tax=Calcarisporiella thermophila TaxID=911321 RepID=UPI00374360BC
MGSPFKAAKRINSNDFDGIHGEYCLYKEIQQHCIIGGLPLVISNWNKRAEWKDRLFSLEFLKESFRGFVEIRDINTCRDEIMSMQEFISYIEAISRDLSDEKEVSGTEEMHLQRKLYGKDIACPGLWSEALSSILPHHLLPSNKADLFSLVPPELRTPNLMIYIGAEGSSTPGHKDMCSALGHNLMVHTDDGAYSIWFLAKSADRERVAELWQSLNRDIDAEDYLAGVDELYKANFDIFLIEQRLGDLVIVPPNSAHQVINRGGCTIKISWNRIVPETLQYAINETLPIYRRIGRSEQYRIKTIIYFTLTHWVRQLNCPSLLTELDIIEFSSQFLSIFRLYEGLVKDEWLEEDVYANLRHTIEFCSDQHTRSCDFCKCDLWNRFFYCPLCIPESFGRNNDGTSASLYHENDNPISTSISIGSPVNDAGYDLCLECYLTGRSCHHPLSMILCEQVHMRDLLKLRRDAIDYYNGCEFITQRLGDAFTPLVDTWFKGPPLDKEKRSIASAAYLLMLNRNNLGCIPKSLCCHHCNVVFKSPLQCWKLLPCKYSNCNSSFCFSCLFRFHGEKMYDLMLLREWTCKCCKEKCVCRACGKRKRKYADCHYDEMDNALSSPRKKMLVLEDLHPCSLLALEDVGDYQKGFDWNVLGEDRRMGILHLFRKGKNDEAEGSHCASASSSAGTAMADSPIVYIEGDKLLQHYDSFVSSRRYDMAALMLFENAKLRSRLLERIRNLHVQGSILASQYELELMCRVRAALPSEYLVQKQLHT